MDRSTALLLATPLIYGAYVNPRVLMIVILPIVYSQKCTNMMNKVLLFLCCFAGQLSAQSPFASASDSTWFFEELSFPVVNAEFNFFFSETTLILDQPAPPPPAAVDPLPTDPAALRKLVDENSPRKDEAAYQLFLHYYAKAQNEEAGQYLLIAIEAKANQGLDNANADKIQEAVSLMMQYYGNQAMGDIQALWGGFTENYPDNLKGWHLRTLHALQIGDTTTAKTCIEKSKALDPLHPNLFLAAVQLETLRNIYRMREPDSADLKKPLPRINDYATLRQWAKEQPKSYLPQLALSLAETTELYSLTFLYHGGEFEPAPEKKEPIRFALQAEDRKRLQRLQKYYEGIIKNKKYIKPYIAHKGLMLIDLLLGDSEGAKAHYQIIRPQAEAMFDGTLHRLALLPLFVERDYEGIQRLLDEQLKKSFNAGDAMLHARMKYILGDEAGTEQYLKQLPFDQFYASKPFMALAFLEMKRGNRQAAAQWFEAVEARNWMDEDYYYYKALFLYLEGKPAEARPILEELSVSGRDYAARASDYLQRLFP